MHTNSCTTGSQLDEKKSEFLLNATTTYAEFQKSRLEEKSVKRSNKWNSKEITSKKAKIDRAKETTT